MEELGLNQFRETYSAAYPATWEKDLSIARQLEQGREVADIAEEMDCAKEDIYNVVERVRNFLFPGLSDFEILRDYLLDSPMDYSDGNAGSVLESLFCRYEESNSAETDTMRTLYQQLYDKMEHLTIPQKDEIVNTACLLCRNYEMASFVAGVKLGAKLMGEFYSD